MQQCVQQHVQGYEFVDCIPSLTMHMLKTVKVKSFKCPQSNPHIRPACLSLEPNSPIQKLNCEVDTGAGCTVLPYSILKSTFGDVTLKPATVRIITYDDNAVKVMGPCIIHAYSGKTVYKLECQVTKTEGYFILGRDTAVKMNCVNFPEVKPPQRSLHNIVSTQAVSQESATVSVDKLTKKRTVPDKVTEPVKPTVKCNRDSITLNGGTHSLPTTKEYFMKKYKDVFSGIGTLPGGPYHIQLKENYKAAQHAPCQVAVSLKSAYKAEFQRLPDAGIITEVHGHTEWINSIFPVKKPDGSLRLCFDPKELNKAIKRNQWYCRTIDDVLPELVQLEVVSMTDTNSGYQEVPLDLASSLLTTFNTHWGKFRFLKLPFGLKMAGDVFQERLDKITRLVDGVISIADDILIPGKHANQTMIQGYSPY